MSTNMSTAAREFLARSEGVQWETADLSPKGVRRLRRENSECAAMGWKCLLNTEPWCASIVIDENDESVGGVPCRWVSAAAAEDRHATAEEVVLYLHGGGFVVGSPEDDMSMIARIAARFGRPVCAPRYRLAPEHPFPAARDDVWAVYSALVASGKTRIYLCGQSAGGNLALALALRVASTPATAIAANTTHHQLPLCAVALLSPWIDLAHSGESHARDLDPTLSVEHFLHPAAMAYAGGRDLRDPEISPLFGAFGGEDGLCFPPLFLSSATRDLLLSDCVRLVEKLKSLGGEAMIDFHVAEGLWHVFEWHAELPEAAASLNNVANFFSRSFQPMKK